MKLEDFSVVHLIMKFHKRVVLFSALLGYSSLTYMIIGTTTFTPADWSEEAESEYGTKEASDIESNISRNSAIRRVQRYRPRHVHSDISNGESEQPHHSHLSSGMSFEDLGEVMSARRTHLQAKCDEYKVLQEMPFRPWTIATFTRNSTFAICVAPKVGSQAWNNLIGELRSRKATGYHHELSSVISRHPLDRLVSAYRDKYVNGKPIFMYGVIAKKSGSVQSWEFRWLTYWLPALISKGLVDATPEFINAVEKYSKDFRTLEEIIKDVTVTENLPEDLSKPALVKYGALARHILGDIMPASFARTKTDKKIQWIMKAMFRYGKDAGMRAAIKDGYSRHLRDRLRHEFADVSFTFSDFLNHVIWTFEVDLADQHWMPITSICDPCRMKFQNIIRTENSDVESEYIIKHLGLKDKLHLPRIHKAVSDSGKPYFKYFKNISTNTIQRIQNIYKLDFYLWNYTMLDV